MFLEDSNLSISLSLSFYFAFFLLRLWHYILLYTTIDCLQFCLVSPMFRVINTLSNDHFAIHEFYYLFSSCLIIMLAWQILFILLFLIPFKLGSHISSAWTFLFNSLSLLFSTSLLILMINFSLLVDRDINIIVYICTHLFICVLYAKTMLFYTSLVLY